MSPWNDTRGKSVLTAFTGVKPAQKLGPLLLTNALAFNCCESLRIKFCELKYNAKELKRLVEF